MLPFMAMPTNLPSHPLCKTLYPEGRYHFTVPQQYRSDLTSPQLPERWELVLSFMLESLIGMCMVLHWGLNFRLPMTNGEHVCVLFAICLPSSV